MKLGLAFNSLTSHGLAWRSFVRLSGALVLAAGLSLTSGCATTPGGPDSPLKVLKKGEQAFDPIEGINRAVFSFNTGADNLITKPIAKAYRFAVPELFRGIIGNVLLNINDVWVGVNSLLQGKPKDALSDWTRVLINSTFGLAGVADVASDLGLERHNEDFGQTLGKWGVPTGPYLVLPLLGPSNFRDGFSIIPDALGDPIRKIRKAGDRDRTRIVRLVDTRANFLDVEKIADSAAIDRYDLVRDAYLARRKRLVYDGDPPEENIPEEGNNK
jgi:phospholipid-binding lipoprotein MlaA